MFFILLCTIFSQKKLPKSDSLVFVKFSGKIAKSARLLSVSFTKKYNYRINADDNCTFALLIFRLHRGTCLRPMPITHLCFALLYDDEIPTWLQPLLQLLFHLLVTDTPTVWLLQGLHTRPLCGQAWRCLLIRRFELDLREVW